MSTRRHLSVPAGVAVIVAIAVAVAAGSDAPAAGPAASLERLRRGNDRFVADAAAALPIDARRRADQVAGQQPFAAVLSCADSRVPPEVIFNAGLGELFVVRTAGAAVDKAVLASVEYAVEHLRTPLVVVMGHESCGAVKAALAAPEGTGSQGPNLDYLLQGIRPAFDRLPMVADQAGLRDAILANVEQVVNDLIDRSAVLRGATDQGHVQIVGAYYELSTGRARFSAPVAAASSPATP